ncbi:hypothetical protein [Pseudomonas lactucae]|uniref:Uncharacterized protein n=1 Tax=Pseudomonas lactucae TaxID=2813360 RepID=A0A9X0YJ05_9PSED|nr:hypothetical protein [Pseudomonas lactucae]MBN2979614.1 hypothetical protein [Pseudomonas lactucae]MBN2986909.1 hypothetical protein [Pseudomonas lactucae]
MTQTKSSAPAENPWDSYFLNGESVSDDFMSEDDRLDDLELRQVIQQRLKAIENARESRIRYRLIPFAEKPNLLRVGFIKKH